MARKPRLDPPGAVHHVIATGIADKPIFTTARDARSFLRLLAATSNNSAVEVHGYALLSTHYHLLVRSLEGKLSTMMASLGSQYSRRFGLRHGTDGRVFGGRFWSTLVESDRQLLVVSRYIHRNPVDAGSCDRPSDYQWSSYRAYLGQGPAPVWLTTDVVLGLAGGPDRLRRFVETDLPTDKRSAR